MSSAKPFEKHEIGAAPGTEILFDHSGDHLDSHGEFSEYQHLDKGDSRILLVPQPSITDPNDPLRWSTTKKWATFLNALSFAFLGGVTGPIIAACEKFPYIQHTSMLTMTLGMVQGSHFFGKSLQEMTYANGATLFCQGVATTLWM